MRLALPQASEIGGVTPSRGLPIGQDQFVRQTLPILSDLAAAAIRLFAHEGLPIRPERFFAMARAVSLALVPMQ